MLLCSSSLACFNPLPQALITEIYTLSSENRFSIFLTSLYKDSYLKCLPAEIAFSKFSRIICSSSLIVSLRLWHSSEQTPLLRFSAKAMNTLHFLSKILTRFFIKIRSIRTI
ncbi:unnamed protein product [Moneuplotes crassus]|uniref:Uncharacterized protein n=1 Tax=Euplotes crassus TaxID=5936 RepID=A0AAD1U5L4_EUPCR|nr:unnamed protein product [Moneuplotes crassus]